MYVRVTSPTKDSTIRVQFNFKPNPPSTELNELTEGLKAPSKLASTIEQALTCSFILVGQPAPNAFVLVPRTSNEYDCLNPNQPTCDKRGESKQPGSVHRRPRFHVIIGSQLCSCQDHIDLEETCTIKQTDSLIRAVHSVSQPCVHVLFVMLRVLKVPADDPCLMQVPLPTSKAESLIQQYQYSKALSRGDPIKGHKCSVLSISDLDSKSPSTLKTTQTSLPLAMPKPIYAHRSGVNSSRTPQLLALLNAKVQNSPECQELSTLTKDIKAVSRLGTESAGATIESGSTNPTSTTMSRPSSSDSAEGSRFHVTSAYSPDSNKDSSGLSTAGRRPQTAPQADPPTRAVHGRTFSMRHACSTTFRPIRDHSPQSDGRLSPIQSGDVSTNNSLRFRSEVKQHSYETLRQPPQRGINSSSGASPKQATVFQHVSYSPFKPVINRSPTTSLDNKLRVSTTYKPGTFSSVESNVPIRAESWAGQDETCVLCLQPFQGDNKALVRCRSNESSPHCLATFHLTCYQIWLEEISLEGDSPHCPVCLSRWDTTPFTIEKVQSCNSIEIPSVAPNTSSHYCLCEPEPLELGRNLILPVDGGETQQAVTEVNSTSNPVPERASQLPPNAALNAKCWTNQEASAHPSQTSPPIPQSYPPYTDYNSCIAAFSLEVADGIAAHNCVTRRQWALQRAAQLTVQRILVARHQHKQAKRKSADGCQEHEGQLSRERRTHAQSATPPSASTEPDCLRVMFRLIQHLFDDPADVVFIDALRAFRELLGYLVCFNAETQTALQRAIAPILRRLLRFVGGASVLWTLRSPTSGLPTPILMHQTSINSVESWKVDRPITPEGRSTERAEVFSRQNSNGTDRTVTGPKFSPPPTANLRDRANLALATLVELAKGQHGALALGRDVGCAAQCLPVCGLQHLTRFVLSSAKFHATHLIGRLTLLDKLIRMDQTLPSSKPSVSGTEQATATTLLPDQLLNIPVSPPDRLARRHLCSSLVFARRHLLPPTPNAEMAICFPHHYQYQTSTNPEPALCASPVGNTGSGADLLYPQNLQNNPALDSLYNTQLKASRVARRVFLTAARSLLTYGNRGLVESTLKPTVQSAISAYAADDFCPREFVEVEINRTEAPLAAWLRNKLAPLLYPNLVVGPEPSLIPVRMTLSEAPDIPPRNAQVLQKNAAKLPTSHTIETLSCATVRNSENVSSKSRSSSPMVRQKNISPSVLLEHPPTPPPRRKLSIAQDAEADDEGQFESDQTHFLRIALEPAYDLVPLSESGNYSSASECEEDEDVNRQREQLSDCVNEPTYGGRSLGSEAELRTEQNAVLRSALRRCSRSLRPLLPVPALLMVMDAFRSTKKLPSADEYYESIDWIRGPILGHGAFSHCYQARDTRTGLLMAVKRIRLGGGSVFPVPTGKSKADKPHGSDGPVNAVNPSKGTKDGHCRLQKTSGILTAEAAAQLSEVEAEVDIMIRLSHPNVVRLFGVVFCSHRNLVDLFIEWMPGGSITSLLRQYGAFNEPLTLAYGVQVVRGLAYLHKHGILHRDLKGANLLVDHTGSVVRISDFGASARLSGDKSVAGQFQGQIIGTFSFMAPEVLRGETYGRACDIWSVGCCLIEMLTSKPPWHDAKLTNRYALMFAIATSESPPTYPSDLDEDMVDILDACFARHAPSRPTASRLLSYRAFARLTESFSPSKPPDESHSMQPPGCSRSRTAETGSTLFDHNSTRKSKSKNTHCVLPPLPRSSSMCPNTMTRVA